MSVKKERRQTDPVRAALAETLDRLGISRLEDAVSLLQSPSVKKARDACWLLGMSKKKSYAAPLFEVLSGRRKALWHQAGVSLSLLESKRMTPQLLQLMADTARPAAQREAAAYALAFTWSALADARYAPSIGEAFLTILRNPDESPTLRGQVAEGLAYLYGNCIGTRDRRSRVFKTAGQSLIDTLSDPAPEVRFWSAFALGSMRYRAAVPALQELAQRDQTMYANWWTVGEEASDAIDSIKGRESPVWGIQAPDFTGESDS